MTFSFLEGQSSKSGRLEDLLRAKFNARDEDYVSQSDTPHAYASEALTCARKVSLRIIEADGTKNMSTGTGITLSIGTHLHDIVQKIMENNEEYYRAFQGEVRWDDVHLTGRADGLYYDVDGVRTVLEIKSVGDFVNRKAKRSGNPEQAHLIQAALSALYFEADQVHIVYVSKVSKGDDPSITEWFIPMTGKLVDDAKEEYNRLYSIAVGAANGRVENRVYDGQLVLDPESTKFPCGWCPFKSTCVAIGPGTKTVDSKGRYR